MLDTTLFSPFLLVGGIVVTLYAIYLTRSRPRSVATLSAWIVGLGILGLNAVLLLVPPLPTSTTPAVLQNPIPRSAESIAQGQVLYTATCARCHGTSLTGDGPDAAALAVPPANLWEHIPHHEDGDHFALITTGKGTMPGFGETLSETERWHLINYLRDTTATGPAETMPPMDEMEH